MQWFETLGFQVNLKNQVDWSYLWEFCQYACQNACLNMNFVSAYVSCFAWLKSPLDWIWFVFFMHWLGKLQWIFFFKGRVSCENVCLNMKWVIGRSEFMVEISLHCEWWELVLMMLLPSCWGCNVIKTPIKYFCAALATLKIYFIFQGLCFCQNICWGLWFGQ